jgi:hypothetical protein
VFAKLCSRRSFDFSSRPTPTPRPPSPNSHGIISFTDPHPLNSVVSYRYKNMGGEGASTPQSPSPVSNLRPTIPLFIYPLFFHSLMKCKFCNPFVLIFMHVMGGSTPSLEPCLPIPCFLSPIPFLFILLRTLLHFLHSRKTQPFYFQAIPHSLHKTPGGGEGRPVK